MKASLNHPMQAIYDVWFYEDILGIRPDVSGPGFKIIRFNPTMTSYMEWAKGSVESPYGTISSSWRNEQGKLNWKIRIPANSSGLVALPANKKIIVNNMRLSSLSYPVVEESENYVWYHFPSGLYNMIIE